MSLGLCLPVLQHRDLWSQPADPEVVELGEETVDKVEQWGMETSGGESRLSGDRLQGDSLLNWENKGFY